MKPSHGLSGLDVPPETSLLIAELSRPPGSAATDPANSDSPGYVAVLPLSDTHARASLHRAGGDESDGNTSAAAGNDACALAVSADTGDAAVLLPDTLGVMLVAAGPDPFRLVQRLVLTARQRLREQLGVECSGEEGPAEAVTLVSQEAGFVDKLGWCTWDSFYTMVTPEGIVRRTMHGSVCQLIAPRAVRPHQAGGASLLRAGPLLLCFFRPVRALIHPEHALIVLHSSCEHLDYNHLWRRTG